MKADAHLSAEEDALRWATEFFKGDEAIKSAGSKEEQEKNRRYQEEVRIRFMLLGHDENLIERRGPDGSIDRSLALFVDEAQKGNLGCVDLVFALASGLIRRGDPLPEPLRDFVAEYLLQNTRRKQSKKPGPGAEDLIPRNYRIAVAVLVVAWVGFPYTRNAATKSHSAASIVRDALEAAGVYLTEKAVNKIFETMQKKHAKDLDECFSNIISGKGYSVS